MTNEVEEIKVPLIPRPIPWEDFLESQPPGSEHWIQGLAGKQGIPHAVFEWNRPVLKLYCASPDCDADMNFEPLDRPQPASGEDWKFFFLLYRCRHCEKTTKIFAVKVRQHNQLSPDGVAAKLGEWPPFGPHIPSKLITLLRDDRDLFMKGRRAESQGLGIGAYAYYRRVVENQKNHLIDEIIKISRRIKAAPEALAILETARAETQFSKALDLIKDAIPSVLRIDEHSPLQLLHQATSKGVHELSDQECLDNATTIRVVLADLAERMNQALKDDRELREAIGRLTRPSEQNEKAESSGQTS